jgi:phosphoribosylamine-glycine ligase
MEAADHSLDILEEIDFESIYYRTDIGYEFKPAATKDIQ